MTSGQHSPNLEPVEEEIKDMKLKSGNSSDEEVLDTITVDSCVKDEAECLALQKSPVEQEKSVQTLSLVKRSQSTPSYEGANDAPEREQVLGGEFTVKQEPGQPLKLERKASQKVVARPPPLFDHYEDKTDEARSTFQTLESCTYSSKWMGYTEHAMECDCSEDWDPATGTNHACGEDSDCINRATKMECVGDCGCGADCQNQRFQRRQYADITIIRTEKKGYGVRANSDLTPGQFIFEYIGEVINEGQFRKRMIQYDEEGIKHFYFMSLSKGEFVDATKRGNLGRFCNHSCNPNSYVDKWVVGDKLRMGIFAERKIKAGEELVFNYNVDRYGADPQPCYCGEPNCTGFIGGKTQTERATKLSNATIEALGIDDGDGWDTAVAKRPRKKKMGEDDEEYVDSVQPRSLDEDGVTKVMAALMQCKEKWIAVKLLGRVQRCDDTSVRNRVIRMHGYRILKTTLSTFKDDVNVVLQIFDILDSFPRVTRNKIADSKIEETISEFLSNEDERVAEKAQTLLKEWAALETAYRIPRKKRDPNAERDRKDDADRRGREDRRRRSRTRSRSRSRSPPLDAPKGPSAPTGPKNHFPQRAPFHRPFRPRPIGPLPSGWFAHASEGRTYYYTASGQTSWTRPTMEAAIPPPPPKTVPAHKALDDIINEITSQKAKTAETVKASADATPQSGSDKRADKHEKSEKKPKWMSYDESKKKKLYKNTLYPVIKHVIDKFKHKLPKEDLKRHFKDILEKLVESDFRKKRVEDPTLVSEKQEKNIKKFTKEYLDKAVVKRKDYDAKKAAKEAAIKEAKSEGKVDAAEPATLIKPELDGEVKKEESDEDVVMEMSDDEDIKEEVSKSVTPATPLDSSNTDSLKRKRIVDVDENGVKIEDFQTSPNKRARSATPPAPAPPPPPPPPPSTEDSPSEEPTPTRDESRVNWDRNHPIQGFQVDATPPPLPPPREDATRSDEDDMLGDNAHTGTNGIQPDRLQAVQT